MCVMPLITMTQVGEVWTCPECHVVCEAQVWEDHDSGSIVRTGIEWVKVAVANA